MKKHCALCLNERKLCKSHIIPEFVYKPLYNEDRRIDVLSVLPNRKDWQEQKGLWEYLLCETCEQKLSVCENYSRKVLFGGTTIEGEQEGNLIRVRGLDYANFKLFQLSILWRSSVSSLPFFERVNLGHHEEELRQLLVNSAPGAALQYPCVMFALKSPTGVVTDLIMQPERMRLDGHTAYRFIFGGILWAFIVSSHTAVKILSDVVLNEDGSLSLLIRPPEEIRPLSSFAQKHRELGRS